MSNKGLCLVMKQCVVAYSYQCIMSLVGFVRHDSFPCNFIFLVRPPPFARAGEPLWESTAAAAAWLLHGVSVVGIEMGITVASEAGIEPAVALLQVPRSITRCTPFTATTRPKRDTLQIKLISAMSGYKRYHSKKTSSPE
jgi:hypothetical protein